jgi:photosystem II stability/assembly factor-like uncharacterized protein
MTIETRTRLLPLTTLAALVSLVVGGLFAATPSVANAAPVADPLERPALTTPKAARASMLAVTRAGERLVAVGERGLVLLSDDDGRNWRQAPVPVSVTLTAVAFPTAQQGWAVGHSGVVLHTEDGGQTWRKQLDGAKAAQMALDAAQAAAAAAPGDKAAQNELAAAQRRMQDGPDKPFLALHFADEKNGFIAGAYGLLFATSDGGVTWLSRIAATDNPQGMNLYAVTGRGATVYLAGERGFFARSEDGGKHFVRIKAPYEGSWFTLALPASGQVFLGGLRGNAWLYDEQRMAFTQSQVPSPVSFTSVLALADSRLLFVNQAGQVLESRDGGRTLALRMRPPGAPLAALAPAREADTLIGAGFGGVMRLTPNSRTSGGTQ